MYISYRNYSGGPLKAPLCPIERCNFEAKCKFIMRKILENMAVKNIGQTYLTLNKICLFNQYWLMLFNKLILTIMQNSRFSIRSLWQLVPVRFHYSFEILTRISYVRKIEASKMTVNCFTSIMSTFEEARRKHCF